MAGEHQERNAKEGVIGPLFICNECVAPLCPKGLVCLKYIMIFWALATLLSWSCWYNGSYV